MNVFIDTHTHLEYEYPFSTEEYLKNAKDVGVQKFITIGTTPESLLAVESFSEKYPDVFFTVGIHPHDSILYNDSVEQEIKKRATHSKCVGIGEFGLDFHYDHSPRQVQIEIFRKQLSLAIELKKPIVIHSREAEDELLEGLKDYVSKTPLKERPGVIHCFSGSYGFGEQCLKLGFYLSFSGIITFKKADDLRLVVRDTPLDRILLETDAPFLSPIPYRGKPNQSAYLIETAKKVAELKGLTLEEVARQTTLSAKKVFKI